MKKDKRLDKGITMVSLIITIVIMLILAGVSITGAINGGLFKKAEDANDSVKIASERQIIQKAIIYAKGKSRTGKVTAEDLQKEINNIIKEENENATVTENGDTISVNFNDTKNSYEVSKEGKVEGPKELVEE